jgi:23S rRNA (cytosine1962-C5)-methyltransferase
VLLIQTWREALTTSEIEELLSASQEGLGTDLTPAYRHRGPDPAGTPSLANRDEPPEQPVGHEMGMAFDVRPHYRGQDPLLFLDLRAGRRRVSREATGCRVLNLFAYTCGVGVAAVGGGATEVWSVDFAASALAVGRRNAELNGIPPEQFQLICEDAIPILRQLAGLPIKRRGRRRRTYTRVDAQQFDIVVLDPPRWSKSAFGAVDVVRDYPALFKPAVLATRPGGHVLATNHVPTVNAADWHEVLVRCARKAGRPLESVEAIDPDADFPSFDGHPPLKMAWVTVGPPG